MSEMGVESVTLLEFQVEWGRKGIGKGGTLSRKYSQNLNSENICLT